jgi:hypothetical protein
MSVVPEIRALPRNRGERASSTIIRPQKDNDAVSIFFHSARRIFLSRFVRAGRSGPRVRPGLRSTAPN